MALDAVDETLFAGLRPTRRFASTTSADIRVCEDQSGRLLVVKMAKTADAARVLLGQVRQMRRLSAFAQYAPAYPPILRATDNGYVIPYYPRGTIDQALQRGEDVAPLVSAAFAHVFRVALAKSDGRDDARPDPAQFLRQQFRFRADRLMRVLEAPNDGFRQTAGGALVRLVERIEGQLERVIEAREALPPLGLCAHGDLGLDNVVLTGIAENPVVFIDTRDNTPWSQGLPWWDPIFDLATLILYHAHIEPAVAAVSATKGASQHAPDRIIGEDRFLALAAALPSFDAWIEQDRGWRRRLWLAMTIRTLGSVGTQLTSAPDERVARAARISALLSDFVDRNDRLWRDEEASE